MEIENSHGCLPLLLQVEFAFGREIKRRVRLEQEGRCARCGEVVSELEIHHRVPANALRRGLNGVKGKDIRENAVGLCHGEHGDGAGSKDDCHEIADKMAIEKHLFYKDGRFVKLEEIDPETYTRSYGQMPERGSWHKRGKQHHR